jgi:homocysteine S-methyltransferase
MGPYGAFLADGSEYTGRYPVGHDGLMEFHHERWHLLAQSSADLLAVETVPSGPEIDVLIDLMGQTPERGVWLSLSCADSRHLIDGTPLARVAERCDTVANLIGLGVNCTGADAIHGLLSELAKHTSKPLLAYPNGGGDYEAETRQWGAPQSPTRWLDAAPGWVEAGARALGGCCRVDPDRIRDLRRRVLPRP